MTIRAPSFYALGRSCGLNSFGLCMLVKNDKPKARDGAT